MDGWVKDITSLHLIEVMAVRFRLEIIIVFDLLR